MNPLVELAAILLQFEVERLERQRAADERDTKPATGDQSPKTTRSDPSSPRRAGQKETPQNEL